MSFIRCPTVSKLHAKVGISKTPVIIMYYRIGLDKHLGENYDPMSTAPQDAALFRKCVSDLQTQQGLKECQAGSMCANTITRVKQMLHTQKGKPVHHVDKKNVCV